ncbi:MAG TPA: hypothetical protein VMV02_05860 [Acidimicrobiales bacterium]|nr:hypothetical protein [Acidimicrobiales bacterium]
MLVVLAGVLVVRGIHHAPPARGAPAAPVRVQVSVALARCTFVDTSRSTMDYVDHVSTPGRRIVAEVYYPTYALASGGRALVSELSASERGPHPAVFFVGGYNVDPSRYSALLTQWAGAGIVVVALEPPDANEAAIAKIGGSFADEADIPNQPGDVAFATRRVLADAAGRGAGCRVLRGLVDPAEIGLAGQSDGGTTVAMLEFDQGAPPGQTATYRSLAAGLHYRAIAVMSGAAYGDDPYAALPGSPPLLVVQSATDRCNPPVASVDLYAALAATRRWFLGLRDARHLTPYEGQAAAAFAVVSKVTLAFFSAALRGGDPGPAMLAAGNARPSVAALTSGATVPPFVDVPRVQSAASCYET